MNLKLLGVFFIMFSSILCGIKKANSYKEHYEELLYLKRVFIMIRGEIRYNIGTLSEVFFSVGKKLKDVYRESFLELSDRLLGGSGTVFRDEWENVVISGLKECKLWEKDLEMLREVGENMGYLDMEMQLGFIDLYLEKLEEEIINGRAELKTNMKLYKVLGVMGGMLISILIL